MRPSALVALLLAACGDRPPDPEPEDGAMFREATNRRFTGASTRPIYITDASRLHVKSLARAVVALHAIWSAPSAARMGCLASLRDTPDDPWLYIVDIDSVPPEWIEQQFGAVSHGSGEIFWIRDGIIIDHDRSSERSCEAIARATQRLFTGNVPGA